MHERPYDSLFEHISVQVHVPTLKEKHVLSVEQIMPRGCRNYRAKDENDVTIHRRVRKVKSTLHSSLPTASIKAW